jgi:endonuclease YncB( thermonuclease family)
LNEKSYNDLENLEEAPEFSLNFKIFLGKVLHVTDGDTLKIAILINKKFTRFNFRLNGIDTP